MNITLVTCAGEQSVLAMVRLLEGEDPEDVVYGPTLVVDEANAEEYLTEGGLK